MEKLETGTNRNNSTIHDGIKQPVMAKKYFFFDGLNLNTFCPHD